MGMRRTKQNSGEGGWVSDWVKEIQTERVSSIQAQSHTASATIGHPQQRTWKQKENSEKKQTLIDNYIYNVYIFRPVSHAVSCFSPMYTVFGVVRVAGRWTTQPLLHSCPERTTCHVYTYITSVFVTYASERTACTDTHTHERTHAVTSSWFYVHKQKQKENWMTRSRHGTHAMLEGEIVFRSLFLFSVSFFFSSLYPVYKRLFRFFYICLGMLWKHGAKKHTYKAWRWVGMRTLRAVRVWSRQYRVQRFNIKQASLWNVSKQAEKTSKN